MVTATVYVAQRLRAATQWPLQVNAGRTGAPRSFPRERRGRGEQGERFVEREHHGDARDGLRCVCRSVPRELLGNAYSLDS